MKLIAVLALALAAATGARSQDLVFETRLTRLAIRPDAVASSLTDKQSGKELLSPQRLAFAAAKKGGRLFPATAAVRRGDMLHLTFGTSGVDADYRITAKADYIVVELTTFHGDGIEEIRLMQLSVSMKNAGGTLGVLWDDEFAVCLIGLSARVYSSIEGQVTLASLNPAFPMQGERIAIIAAPTPRFLEAVRKVEQDFGLPSPMIGGAWAKFSEDVRTSYLFTDLTEANADETIRYAKLGGFRYILVYSGTWSASVGSYPIHTRNFPHGEDGLKTVIGKCHAVGLKVGMHMMTSFVGKNDPMVHPKPSPWLLKDAEAALATDVSESVTQLGALSALSGPYGAAGDILIDDEIVHYGEINAGENAKLLQCVRGFVRTQAAPHKAGAKIYHLVERDGSYLADLRSPLKDAISDRVAGLINRCGFDMIYFDGGEVNSATEPSWYWMGAQQAQIWEKSKRQLLVQGSGMTNWTWNIFSRGTSDDGSAVAVKEYLDYHKIADSWKAYRTDFLPAELGWAAFLDDARDHPATMPDDVEFYAVRMLALDSGVSYETNLNALRANGRSEEMLRMLGEYERLQLSGAVPKAVRQQLATGEWHMMRPGEFHPVRYDAQRVTAPGEVTLRNEFGDQPLKFRLQAAPTLAAVGDPSNIPLLRAAAPIEIQPPDSRAVLPGSIIRHFEFAKAAQDQVSGFTVGPETKEDKNTGKPLDLTKHRALAVQLDVERVAAGTVEIPVLNIQLEGGGGGYREYYVDLDFTGPKTVILAEPSTKRMLPEFRPAFTNYPFKAAMGGFDYGDVAAVNLRWMRYPNGSAPRCRISRVEALEERDSTLRDIEISSGSMSIAIPAGMKTGDYAEYWGDGTIRVFGPNGIALLTVPVKPGPQLKTGESRWTIKAAKKGAVVFTAITLGR